MHIPDRIQGGAFICCCFFGLAVFHNFSGTLLANINTSMEMTQISTISLVKQYTIFQKFPSSCFISNLVLMDKTFWAKSLLAQNLKACCMYVSELS